jgi:hypothetical protein
MGIILVLLFISFLILLFDIELYYIDKILGILAILFYVIHLFLKDFIYKKIGWINFSYNSLTIKTEKEVSYDIDKVNYVKIEYNNYRHFYAPLFQFRMGFETGKDNTVYFIINNEYYTYNFLSKNKNDNSDLQQILSIWKKNNVLIDYYYKNEKKSL